MPDNPERKYYETCFIYGAKIFPISNCIWFEAITIKAHETHGQSLKSHATMNPGLCQNGTAGITHWRISKFLISPAIFILDIHWKEKEAYGSVLHAFKFPKIELYCQHLALSLVSKIFLFEKMSKFFLQMVRRSSDCPLNSASFWTNNPPSRVLISTWLKFWIWNPNR